MKKSYQESRRTVWTKIVSTWVESNQSIETFCKTNGYSKGNFFRWKKRFEDEGTMQKVDNASKRHANWEQIISDWSESGLSISAYCRLHGYAISTFANWRKRIQDTPVKSGNFVSVKFQEPSPRSLRIVLDGDIEIKFTQQADSHYLDKVIEALQAVC